MQINYLLAHSQQKVPFEGVVDVDDFIAEKKHFCEWEYLR